MSRVRFAGLRKVLAAALLASISRSAFCEEPTPGAALRERWKQAYQRVAASIDMRRRGTSLELHSAPLLFYTNPVRTNDQHGAIFLWTEEARPAVFGSIWSSVNRTDAALRNVNHEWHSLVEDDDVFALRGGETLWVCGEPGIAWQSLSDSPDPAESRPGRLLQMRNLARRLSVAIDVEDEADLRLMSQPLYRYPEATEGAIDGAIFVFTMATDPELIVLVEAQDQKPPRWVMGLARFGARAMTVHDGAQMLWSCERVRPPLPQGKYHLVWRAEQMPAEPAAGEEAP